MVSKAYGANERMKKIEGWEDLLTAFLIEHKTRPFSWGSWDCVSFVDECYKRLTRFHVIPEELHWSCERTAILQIQQYGYDLRGSVKKALLSKGFSLIRSGFKKSDIVIFKENDSDVCGIFNGQSVCAVSDEGITVKSKEQIVEAYRCG